MKIVIVAVGLRMPGWAETAFDDYRKRLPPELQVECHGVKAETRGSKAVAALLAAESTRIEAAIRNATRGTARTVALDERGTAISTRMLAARLTQWQLQADDVAIVLGGPDGLDAGFKNAAHEQLRLSDLTLPHALARVLLIEQLYRAWSINAGHPYHRE